MITRRRVYLELRDDDVSAVSQQIEREGYGVLERAFDADEIAELRREIEAVYEDIPADVRNPKLPAEFREDFRYEMLNRSRAAMRAVADRRLLDVVEPLLGEDCHVIANTAWRNPPREEHRHGGGHWHIDAGPHVPRPEGVPWDERIPYPVFAVGVHLLLQDCPIACGPTAVIPFSHRSGRMPPFERVQDETLEHEGRGAHALTGKAGDVAFFASDVWHRRLPTLAGDRGRFFLQVHYGRRDLAQRLRPTAESNQLTAETIDCAADARTRSVLGLHAPLFYDG